MKTSALPDASEQTLEVLRKIPLFKDLSLSELEALFDICQYRQFQASETIYQMGDPGQDMFILLEGELTARAHDRIDIARISPVDLVGEMGLFTGEPRSASVIATSPAAGLVIRKEDLADFFSRKAGACQKVLINVIKILSHKLYTTNVQIENIRKNVPEMSKEVDAVFSDNIFLY